MYLQTGDISLYYEKCGSGRPLILLHGNGEDHTIFREGAEILKERFTCYMPDSRSHGRSTPVKELHYRDMADDMVSFMEQLDLKDVLFFGFSDGGIIGLLAASQSDRITTLVTCGANLTPDGIRPFMKLQIRLMNLLRPDPKLLLMLKEPHIGSEQLGKIKAKTLLLIGEYDVVSRLETETAARCIPEAEMRIVRGEKHGSYIVHSTRFVRYVIYADSR